ncbi:MAG: peptidase S10, partial [Bradyrhizobium sp.]
MTFRFTARRHMRFAVALLALCFVAGARAQGSDEPREPPSQQQPAATPPASPSPSGQKGGARRGGDANSPAPAGEQHRLPPDSTTKQTLALPGRPLDFTATAGSIRLFDDKGEPQADIAYTSYQLDGTDRSRRPVTFLFNGGPGASSAWLQ